MRPRIFIFCSYLHKKLCDDVLGPSNPFLDPLRPSVGPNRGPKFVDIRENSLVQAVIPRGTDRRSACFKLLHRSQFLRQVHQTSQDPSTYQYKEIYGGDF